MRDLGDASGCRGLPRQLSVRHEHAWRGRQAQPAELAHIPARPKMHTSTVIPARLPGS